MNEWHVHGGRLAAVRAAYPDAPAPWLDLSTGINPHAWDIAQAGAIDWRALPEPEALRALEAAAAMYFGVAADHVCAVPGTEIGLRLLATLGLPAPFRHGVPGYSTHAAALPGSVGVDRAELDVALPCQPGAGRDPVDGAELDPGLRRGDGDEAIARGGTLLLANPNNPDGVLLPASHLLALADRLGKNSGVLVIDEAFADVDPATSLLAHVAAAPIVVLRSFGKFFGLAGVRLGFVIADPARLAGLRDRLGSWPLSAAALAIGTAAYRDSGWIAETRIRLAAEAAALDAVLRRHGLTPVGGCPLFRLVESARAPTWFDHLARAGILTRPFDYAPTWLRFGLPGAGLDRLDRALACG